MILAVSGVDRGTMPRSPVSRRWLITINHPDFSAAEFPTADPRVAFAAWQLEVAPTTGTPHIQAFVRFNRALTRVAVARLYPSAHLQPADGNEEALVAYCTKEDSRAGAPYADPGPHFYGERAQPGRRTDIERAVDCIVANIGQKRPLLEVASVHTNAFVRYGNGLLRAASAMVPPRDPAVQPSVKVYYGPTRTGKTRNATAELPDAYRWTPAHGQWWDGYFGHKAVIMDEFKGQLPYKYLLNLLDRYELQVQVKGAFVEFVATEFIITSSVHPRDWYPNLAHEDGGVDQLLRRITEIVHFMPPLGQRL